jgi:hypothetical protein
MTDTSTAPTARERCRKVRTRTVSSMAPLVLSKLPMNVFELAAGREHMVCPNCRTWCPITGMGKGGTPKLVPHHTEPVGTEEPRRCRGSNRLVTVDVSVEKWRRYRAEGAAETDGRRSTRVLRKPKVPVVAPVHRLIAPRPTLASVRAACLTHREHCTACTNGVWCTDGRRLGSAYVDLLNQEPERSEKIARLERQEEELHEQVARQARERRPQEWAQVMPAVETAALLRYEGPITSNVVMPIKGADVPLGKGTEPSRKRRQKKS